MTNEEKNNEIISTMKSEAADLGFRFDAATENAVRFACGLMADWKDEQIERMKCCCNCEHSKVTDKMAWEECYKTEGRACEKWEMEGGEE